VDLFSIGQGLHWFEDIAGALKSVNSVLRPDSYFLVFAYTIPRINDGSDWQAKLVSGPNAQGFDVIDGAKVTDYKFGKDSSVHSQLSLAYNEMWTKIYPHFRFDRSVIENFYQPFPFAENCQVLKKLIWFDTTPNKSIKAVLGYLESISAYRCYLEDFKIAKGSDQDPLEIVRKKFEELGNPDVDFVTPYYCIALGKKE
jgi:SAM-dependent methyltransferase